MGILPEEGHVVIMTRFFSFSRILPAGLSMLVLAQGCGPPPKAKVSTGNSIIGYEEQRTRIAADPVAFLRESLEAARRLRTCTMTFERQERLGLFKQLQPAESIRAEYRDEPFSVRFTWLNEDSEYLQCVFVEGENGGKVLLLPRKGFLGLAPVVAKYDPSLAVMFSKSRNPISDFGPRRMLERTIDRIEKAKPHGEMKITLRGATEYGPLKEPCFHLELRYPQGDEFPCKLHDLYLNVRTHLPVASILWLPGENERCDETLDGLYVYSGIKSDVELTSKDFVIDANRKVADLSQPTDGPSKSLTSGDSEYTAAASGDQPN